MKKITLLSVSIIAMASIFSGCGDKKKDVQNTSGIESNTSTEQESNVQNTPEDDKTQTAADNKTEVQSITSEELKAMQDDESQSFILIDVRRREAHDAGYIRNAVQVEPADLAGLVQEGSIDKDMKIVIYGSEAETNKREEALDILRSLGYTQVFDLGNIEEWPYELTTALEELTKPAETTEPGVG
jgi:phage shock protein E